MYIVKVARGSQGDDFPWYVVGETLGTKIKGFEHREEALAFAGHVNKEHSYAYSL